MGKVIAGITTRSTATSPDPTTGRARPRQGRRAPPLLGLRRPVDLRRGADRRDVGRGQGLEDEAMSGLGASWRTRTYEAADHWGDENPGHSLVRRHPPYREQPEGDAFRFVGSLDEAIEQAHAAAGDKHVHVMGGARPHPPGARGRARRRAHHHRRAVRPRRRQAPVRRVRARRRARAQGSPPVGLRHVHRLRREEVLRARVDDRSAVAPPRRAVITARTMFSSRSAPCESVEQTISTPAASASAHVLAA